MDRHREAVRRMIQMRLDQAVARRVDASDVVQDVMLEASQRLTGYLQNPSMPFHLWLRQLAKDRIIDMHRRHRAARRRSVDREQNFSGWVPTINPPQTSPRSFRTPNSLPPLLLSARNSRTDFWRPSDRWMTLIGKS
jgi:DNA-directed RNA polymerase specialized sigma24 family protein